MKKWRHSKKGFTLIELAITIAIFIMVVMTAGNFLVFSMRANQTAQTEYDMQSNMRTASETLNNKIRYSPAVFTLKKDIFEKAKKSGWCYFGIEDQVDKDGNKTGKKEIVEYIPVRIKEEIVDGFKEITYASSGKTHERYTVLEEPDTTKFKLTLSQDVNSSDGKLLNFSLEGIRENNLQRKMIIDTKLQSLNAIIVEHAGDPAVAIAYREDTPGKRIKKEEDYYAVITLVLDTSGSMTTKMDDIDDKGKKIKSERIKVLIKQTKKLINDFAAMGDNVFINIIPYATNADTGQSDFLKAKDNVTYLIGAVDNLKASGNTNTGQALMYSYERLSNKPGIDNKKSIKYYNILLTDGEPQAYSYFILKGDSKDPDPKYPSQASNIKYYVSGKNHYYYREKHEIVYPGIDYPNPVTGNSVRGMQYVKHIGKDIIYPSPLNINSYIIGFGNEAKSKEIASYCVGNSAEVKDPVNRNLSKAYYSANNANDLEIVYKDIADIIKGDMWHVAGPY